MTRSDEVRTNKGKGGQAVTSETRTKTEPVDRAASQEREREERQKRSRGERETTIVDTRRQGGDGMGRTGRI